MKNNIFNFQALKTNFSKKRILIYYPVKTFKTRSRPSPDRHNLSPYILGIKPKLLGESLCIVEASTKKPSAGKKLHSSLSYKLMLECIYFWSYIHFHDHESHCNILCFKTNYVNLENGKPFRTYITDSPIQKHNIIYCSLVFHFFFFLHFHQKMEIPKN